MARLWLVPALLLLAASGAGSEPQSIILQTVPPGATVSQGDQVLGKTGEPVVIDLPARDDNATIQLRLTLPDYQPYTLKLQTYALRGQQQYPPHPLPPLSLRPAGNWVVFKLWAADHAAVLGLVLLGLAGALAAAIRWGLRIRQMHQEVVVAPGRAAVQVDRVGTRMGGYDIVERLGEGGTAEVYRAQPAGDAHIPSVAIKIIRTPEAASTGATEGRFRREVEILRQLQHPHIVQLIDWGQEGDTLYLVEELVGGGSLADRIPPHGMTVPEFLDLFRPLIDAVHFAHTHGVVHRDLKPENVLLTEDGRVKVSDFGLARSEGSANLTTSNVMGTPAYMAPEQFSGLVATPLSDQFTLGILGYEMLCGQLPFQGDSVSELMARRLHDPPLVSRVRGTSLPPRLELTVMRMLARPPHERFPTLADVLEALSRV